MPSHSFLRSFLACTLSITAVACAASEAPPPSAPAATPAVATPSAPAAAPPAPAPVVAEPIDRALPRPDTIALSAPIPGFTKGINLGNCFDAPSEGEWGTTISEKHFQMAKSAGLDHVRLPVRFSTAARSDTKPPFTIKEEFFKRVDWAIDQALANKLSIIVDVHHFEEIHKDPNAHKARLYAFWQQIGARYAKRPPEVAFEILNEPNAKLESPILNEMTRDVLKIIRETNPTRLVFANCYFWANAERLAEFELPADDANVVAEFHMYQPILFTHQGAPWMEPWSQTTGLVFPAPPSKPATPVPAAAKEGWVKAWFDGYNYAPAATNPGGVRTVFEHFDHAARYVKKTGKRVYLGEFGAIDVADPQSRENYTWLVRTESERRGMGWSYWDDGGKFKVLDAPNGKWNEGLL
ncbi:MAG TPA: glycoside hydrolase family 5 protein, partial [Polyangiaceae bacterium]